MKIALFEPSDAMRNFIRASLSGNISIVWREFSGVNADSKYVIEHEKIDAIVTSKELDVSDYKMVIKLAQKNKVNQETPIFLLSSDTSVESLNRAFEVGVTDVFVKQDLAALASVFKRMLTLSTCVEGARILIVEDDKSVSDYYAECLRGAHFKVSQAATCEEAEDVLKIHEIELVITDLNLDGGGQGQRVIRSIRRNEQVCFSQIPIMVLSGSSSSQHKTGLFYLGIDDYIVKPASQSQLIIRAIKLVLKFRSHKQILRQQDELKEAAHYDSLTRLYNRHGFQDIAAFCIANAQRQSEDHLGILCIDLDAFKPVNDKYGHRTGDNILKKFSDILKHALREQDIVARWGGDEFVVLLNQCGPEFMPMVVERIQTAVSSASAELLGVGCSIGYAESRPRSFNELLLLIEKADQSMYQQKRKRDGKTNVPCGE